MYYGKCNSSIIHFLWTTELKLQLKVSALNTVNFLVPFFHTGYSPTKHIIIAILFMHIIQPKKNLIQIYLCIIIIIIIFQDLSLYLSFLLHNDVGLVLKIKSLKLIKSVITSLKLLMNNRICFKPYQKLLNLFKENYGNNKKRTVIV